MEGKEKKMINDKSGSVLTIYFSFQNILHLLTAFIDTFLLIKNRLKNLISSIVIVCLMGACSGQKKYLGFEQVKTGYHLDNAKEIALDVFVAAWLENTQPFKLDMNLSELYRDSLFTYFGKRPLTSENFFKVKNDNLRKVDYNLLNGDSIRLAFFNEIIPPEDKKRGKGENCSSTYTKIEFRYELIEAENAIEVKCHYKVTCEFITRLIKADYHAKYDLRKKVFIKN